MTPSERMDEYAWEMRARKAEAALAAARLEGWKAGIEAAAQAMEHEAYCIECHDTVEDLAHSRPYRNAAKVIRALSERGAEGDK